MIEQKDYQSIDEIYRSTLENLPETPNANGWDIPSPEVWKNIQANLGKPASSNGQWMRLFGLLGGAVVVAVAVFVLRQPKNEAVSPVSAPEKTVVQPNASPENLPANNSETAKTDASAAEKTVAQPSATKPEAKPKAQKTQPKNSTEEGSPAKPVDLSTPPTVPSKEPSPSVAPNPAPEKKESGRPIPPNSTLRKQQTEGGGQ